MMGIGWSYYKPKSPETFIEEARWGDHCNPKKVNKRIPTTVVCLDRYKIYD
jgi:hypothetical protein